MTMAKLPRRGTKGNPFEIGERVRYRESTGLKASGVVTLRQGMRTDVWGRQGWNVLVEYFIKWDYGDESWERARNLETLDVEVTWQIGGDPEDEILL